MNSSDVHESKRWYVIAGFGFYPVVGLPWSVACLIRGILTKKLYGTFLMRAALISFVPTVLIIAAYVVTNASLGGMDPKAGLNKRLVSEAISEIEMHKIVTGAYPDLQNSAESDRLIPAQSDRSVPAESDRSFSPESDRFRLGPVRLTQSA